jgi:hypothetical protein
MSKQNEDPLLIALKEGRSYTWTVPEGGNLASMRKAIQHGQTITMSPVNDPAEIQVGDMVLVRWHKGDIFHLVGEIQGERYLIVNSLGGVNGWVPASDILGRVTQVVNPEPRPEVPEMLVQLEEAYCSLIERLQASAGEARRLLAMVDNLRWYASRIGAERLDLMPRENKWSFQQNLWRLTRQARNAATSESPRPACYYIDRGQECLGLAAEIMRLFEPEAFRARG